MTAGEGQARSAVGRISQIDAGARARLVSACGFINSQIDQARSRIVKVGIVIGVLAGAAYAIMWSREIYDPRFPAFGAIALFGLYYARERRQLSKTYKQIVIGRVVKALGQNLTYSAESRFTLGDFTGMDLFLKRAEDWKAEDEVAGRKNAVEYSLLEAKATRTEGSGRSRRTVTIFKGVIVRLDFNKHFRGHTVVVPNTDSKILGGLLGESESRGKKAICRMDNVTFENAFSVYSTDQQEARYVLTPKMMELIMDASRTFGGIRCSFQSSSVFLTIPSDEDRFEVRLWGAKMTPETAVGELAECVSLAERLIDTLDLETRIWSKV